MAESDQERTAVKTYVPTSQKDAWKDHAAELDMTLSEFVRSMVQAGRRGFDGIDAESIEDGGESEFEEPGSPDANPGGNGVRTAVLQVLDEEPRSPDDLVDAVVGDLREEIFDAVEELQAEGLVTHDIRAGGYRVVGDE